MTTTHAYPTAAYRQQLQQHYGALQYAGNGKRHPVASPPVEVIDYTNSHFSNTYQQPAASSNSSGVTTIQPQQYASASAHKLAVPSNPFHYHPPRALPLSHASSPPLYSHQQQLMHAAATSGSYQGNDLPSLYPESPAALYNRRLISSGSANGTGMITPGFPSALSALHPQHAKSIQAASLTNSPAGYGLPALEGLVSSAATTGTNTPSAVSESSMPAFIPWRLSPPSGTHSLQPLRSPPQPFGAALSPLDRYIQHSHLSSNGLDASHSALIASPMLPFAEHAHAHSNLHAPNGSHDSLSFDAKLLVSPGVGRGSLVTPSPRQLNRSLLQSAITQSPELAQLQQQRAHLQSQRQQASTPSNYLVSDTVTSATPNDNSFVFVTPTASTQNSPATNAMPTALTTSRSPATVGGNAASSRASHGTQSELLQKSIAARSNNSSSDSSTHSAHDLEDMVVVTTSRAAVSTQKPKQNGHSHQQSAVKKDESETDDDDVHSAASATTADDSAETSFEEDDQDATEDESEHQLTSTKIVIRRTTSGNQLVRPDVLTHRSRQELESLNRDASVLLNTVHRATSQHSLSHKASSNNDLSDAAATSNAFDDEPTITVQKDKAVKIGMRVTIDHKQKNIELHVLDKWYTKPPSASDARPPPPPHPHPHLLQHLNPTHAGPPSAGAIPSGNEPFKIRLIRVDNTLTGKTDVYVHAADLGGVVERKSNISRLFGQFESPNEKLLMSVTGAHSHSIGQESNVLTFAGVMKFFQCKKMKPMVHYRQWITDQILPTIRNLATTTDPGNAVRLLPAKDKMNGVDGLTLAAERDWESSQLAAVAENKRRQTSASKSALPRATSSTDVHSASDLSPTAASRSSKKRPPPTSSAFEVVQPAAARSKHSASKQRKRKSDPNLTSSDLDNDQQAGMRTRTPSPASDMLHAAQQQSAFNKPLIAATGNTTTTATLAVPSSSTAAGQFGAYPQPRMSSTASTTLPSQQQFHSPQLPSYAGHYSHLAAAAAAMPQSLINPAAAMHSGFPSIYSSPVTGYHHLAAAAASQPHQQHPHEDVNGMYSQHIAAPPQHFQHTAYLPMPHAADLTAPGMSPQLPYNRLPMHPAFAAQYMHR